MWHSLVTIATRNDDDSRAGSNSVSGGTIQERGRRGGVQGKSRENKGGLRAQCAAGDEGDGV